MTTRRFLYLDPDLAALPDPSTYVDNDVVILASGNVYVLKSGAWEPRPQSVLQGVTLPAPLADGYPFIAGDSMLHMSLDGSWLVVGQGFLDHFDRADDLLVVGTLDPEFRGWFGYYAGFHIVGGSVTMPTWVSSNVARGVLHARTNGNPLAADVSIKQTFGSAGAAGNFPAGTGLIIAADGLGATTEGYSHGIRFLFDGSTSYTIERRNGASGTENPTTVTDHGYVGWADTMTLRGVYTPATGLLQIYQNGVLALEADMSAANFTSGTSLPALSTMPNAGFLSNTTAHADIFDDFQVG